MRRLFFAGAAVGLMLLVAAPTDAGQRRLQRKQAARVVRSQGRSPEVRAKRVERLVQSLDKDRNGSISREEWPRHAKAFDRLDANKDGQLTPVELNRVKARKARRR
jgi:Ca2+-binding EF-hand superfamily protein